MSTRLAVVVLDLSVTMLLLLSCNVDGGTLFSHAQHWAI